MIPPPPSLDSFRAGSHLVAGHGYATILPDMDFETYSEAGFVWNDDLQKWDGPPNSPQGKKGLGVVGTGVYAQHPTTDILSLYYDLKDGRGRRHWKPGDPDPVDLFTHVQGGGLIEAWNAGFEHWIWNCVAVRRYGWPPLPQRQLRCAMAKARAFSLPGALDNTGTVLKLTNRKDADGKRLLDKFSVPRKPTKTDPRRRIRPEEDPADAERLYRYNEGDIVTEAEASSLIPDLLPDELAYWLCDQAINYRGVSIDRVGVENCITIVEQAFDRYNTELSILTGGQVEQASQLQRLQGWLAGRGVRMYSMDEEAIEEALGNGPRSIPKSDPWSRRALELRAKVGSASIKKLFAMRNQMTVANRLHELFIFHGARTGRDTGALVQAQNLPKAGPEVYGPSEAPQHNLQCCGRYFGAHLEDCPWCGRPVPLDIKPQEWSAACHEDALTIIATGSLDCVELFFGDACGLVIGVLRGLFIASPGCDLIASDYSAIEAVVLAAIAGEEWRLEVFRTHGKIYETSASKITGIPLAEYVRYKKDTGKHHPTRASIGKIAELASGYQGWIGAWKAFGADQYFSEDEMKGHILAWRAASPNIVELWGGQHRGRPWDHDYRAEYFGLEGAAIQAVLNPGMMFTFQAAHPLARPISYYVRGDVLYCVLPSGRSLVYHEPRLRPSDRTPGELTLSFMGWNTNPKMGGIGWVRMDTYGGKLTENIVQAISRDILRDAVIRLEAANYPVVLRVHDEIVSDIPKDFGSVEEFESLMGTMPEWATGWPLKAAGGWRGLRYRKD